MNGVKRIYMGILCNLIYWCFQVFEIVNSSVVFYVSIGYLVGCLEEIYKMYVRGMIVIFLGFSLKEYFD